MGAVISVEHLRKDYEQTVAVDDVSFEVGEGEIFAILGPNGAGKTTTVEILEGHRDRTAGEVRVLGFDPSRHEPDFRRRIGIVLQSTGVQPYLTVEECIDLFRGYFPHPLPLESVLDAVGLTAKRRRLVKRLSGGEQRRLDVAIGLAGDPELLFLDEPTTGFDPSARRDAWHMIQGLKALGKTILLTTHYMEEAEFLADRVTILVSGRIVAQGSPEMLERSDLTSTVSFRLSPERNQLPPALSQDGSISSADGRFHIETEHPVSVLGGLIDWAAGVGIEIQDLTVSRRSLEDIYLKLVGGSGTEGQRGE